MKKYQYYLFNKPYKVLSQFSKEGDKLTLKDFLNIQSDIYPVGRLDFDSEGLLLLTNNGVLHDRLINPKFNHSRKYLVQVENIPGEESLEKLSKGLIIKGKLTKEANVELLNNDPDIWDRIPPIRFRANIPTAWLQIELSEGMNRQIRRMTAAIGHPALRIIRSEILFLNMENLKNGSFRLLNEKEIYELYKLTGLSGG